MEDLIAQFGIYTLIISFFLDDLGVFLPTTTILFTALIYSQHNPTPALWSILVFAVIIPPISNRILFEAGRRGGRKWLALHGYKVFLPYNRIIKAEKFIERYGEKTIFLTSCIPTMRPFGALIAGSLNMKSLPFTLFNILGTTVMVGTVTGVALLFGEEIWAIAKPFWPFIIIGIFLYTSLHIGYKIFKLFLMTKKILVIGNGGRENAICNACIRSGKRTKIYNFASAINPGIQKDSAHICIGNPSDPQSVLAYAQETKPDFCIIGPEAPIEAGVVDILEQNGFACFAPNKKCAQLETSKGYTRELLKKYNIDASPDFEVFTKKSTTDERKAFFEKFEGQIVVKADGLLGGKGVLVAGDHFESFDEADEFAQKSLEKFGQVVFEEKLIGEEFSLISIVDGHTVLDCPAIQDHKRAFDGDKGPNTGGMGCVSDQHNSLPFLTDDDLKAAHTINVASIKALQKETGAVYRGALFGGFMKTARGIKLIEYNVRFGDPESLIILPLMLTDFVDVCDKTITGKLHEIGTLEFRKKAAVVKYLCPEGYPETPAKNVPLTIDPKLPNDENHKVFFASVAEENDQYILKGSRAIGVLGVDNTIPQANERCQKRIESFHGPLFYRKDIGTQHLMNKKIKHMKDVMHHTH